MVASQRAADDETLQAGNAPQPPRPGNLVSDDQTAQLPKLGMCVRLTASGPSVRATGWD